MISRFHKAANRRVILLGQKFSVGDHFDYEEGTWLITAINSYFKGKKLHAHEFIVDNGSVDGSFFLDYKNSDNLIFLLNYSNLDNKVLQRLRKFPPSELALEKDILLLYFTDSFLGQVHTRDNIMSGNVNVYRYWNSSHREFLFIYFWENQEVELRKGRIIKANQIGKLQEDLF